MAVTRSMTRNQQHGSSSRTRSRTCDNSGPSSWPDLSHDLLFRVMMQLGIVDFVAFSGVCKTWRSFADKNKKKFMASKQHLLIDISSGTQNDCYLKDHEGRIFKTMLPNSNFRTCVGLTCGYLIMFGSRTHDFWLINPITRDELHFPCYPLHVGPDLSRVRGILVFSPSLSDWVFVISLRSSSIISLSLPGKKACWTHLPSVYPIHDLHFFKGKIFILNNTGSHLCEVRMIPEPTVVLYKMKNPLNGGLLLAEFISSGENLYVIDCTAQDSFEVAEVDCDQMNWDFPIKTIEEYAIFASHFKCGAAIKPNSCAGPSYPWSGYYYSRETTGTIKKKDRSFTSYMWYFPQDCLCQNLLQE